MATFAPPAHLALPSGDGSGLALGLGYPEVYWTLYPHDLTRGVLLLGGQGSGKTSMLYRLLLHRAMSPNTALVVFDMKGSLVERLMRRLPDTIEKRYYDRERGEWRTGHKRVWYLDLANASFGLSPLEVREGWTIGGLADTFMNIAGVIVGALKDLFADQIFQSSPDIITRTVIGSMAIAWWEHVEEHRQRGTRAEDYGFSGSFEVLSRMLAPTDEAAIASGGRDRSIPPNPWHVAAGTACQRIPELDQTAYQLLTAIPAAVNQNLSNMTQRFQAPANKITPLVAQYPAVRRFVEQGQRLSLQSVVEAHDILIVNPRMEVLGEDAPEILTTFMVHMLNTQLNRHLAYPSDTRPRLTLGIDEAHRLLTPTLVRMLATHREAGLTVMAATQYFDQIAATLERPAMQQMVRSGIRNLMQTVMIGRTSDPDEAERLAKGFRTVYESLTRSDPGSQARIPVDAANIAALTEYNLLVHAVTASRDNPGTEAQPVFLTRTLPMPEVHQLRQTYRKRHLARMVALFGQPDAQAPLRFVGRPPAGLMGEGGAVPYVDRDADAASVARADVGHRPDRRPSQPRTGERDEWADAREPAYDAPPHDEERLSEDVGGARVHWRPPTETPALDSVVPLLQITMRPTDDPVPDEDAAPQWPLVQDAVRRAAEIEALFGVGAWSSEGDDQTAEADRKASAAREAAKVRAKDQGMDDAATKRYVAAAATHARKEVEAKYADQQWTASVDDLNLSAERMQELRVLAQLPYSHPDILRPLLGNARAERTVQKGLLILRRAALVSTALVKIEDRLGKGSLPALSAVNPRGRELLRHKLTKAREAVPAYLEGEKKLPGDGGPLQGRDVAHELSVQVLAGALCQYGGTDVKCSWQLPNTGGRLAVAAFRKDARGVERRDLLPPTQPDMAVIGYQQAALPVIEPDLSVRFQGPVAGESRSIRVLLEVDRTDRPSYNADKLVAYDHLLAGWYARLERKFGKPPVRPLVLFVSRTEEAARTIARHADATLNLGLGLPGQDPATYLYFGRSHVAFTCLSWLLAGTPYAFRVPTLPRDVRGADMPHELELVELLPRVWWPRAATSAPRAPRQA
jgi:hypothetical protein